MKNCDLSITIPFYNEEKTIEPLTRILINDLERNNINYELILVDNGSNDFTPKIVDKLANECEYVKSVHVEVNQGYGWGILNGLMVATGEFVGYMDGDLEILPEDIVKLYKKIKNANADVGKGVRDHKEHGVLKNIASFGFDALFFILYLRFIKQVNANPKIIRKVCYKKMNLISKGWFIDTEIIIKGLENNYKIVDQIVSYTPRERGVSHLGFFDLFPTIVEYFINIIKFRFFKN